jgi:uncharacterized protein
MRRFLGFPLVRLGLIILIFALLTTPLVLAMRPYHSTWLTVAVTWIIMALLLATMIVVERRTTGNPPAAIGFDPHNAVRDLLLGVALGAALFSVVVLELALSGHYRVTAIAVTPDLAVAALLLLPSAAIEELLFRGVIFRLTQEWSGTWIALAISAAIFGLVHAANPGATWFSTVAIALEAGILLGAAFVLTRNLWFPIGLHFAWNFFEGPIYGTQVSGRTFLSSALVAHLSGPPLLTGGSFGPEASLGAVVTCLVASAVLLIVAVRRSRIVLPNWTAKPGKAAPGV